MNVTQNIFRRQRICVGCGICALVCPEKAIAMAYGRFQSYTPLVEKKLCTNCGLCLEYCPVAVDRLRDLSLHVSRQADPLAYGLKDRHYFVGYDKDRGGRAKSASGGIVTAVLKNLLQTERADAVVHAEATFSGTGAPHYVVCVSRSESECEKRRGSFYAPLCYRHALEPFRHQDCRLVVTGLPCVIRGLRKLFSDHPGFRNNNVVYIALACSHNVSGQFVDFLATSLNVPSGSPFIANLRDKSDIPEADHFNNAFFLADHSVLKGNRFSTLFSVLWRSYCFALPACHYCSDFWGDCADLSVKDAWGKWAKDPLGKSIVTSKGGPPLSLLLGIDGLSLKPLSFAETRDCQKISTHYKQQAIRDRFERHWLARANRQSGFALYFPSATLSRWSYERLGYGLTRSGIRLFLYAWPSAQKKAVLKEERFIRRFRKKVQSLLNGSKRPLAVFGTGRMATDVAAALGPRIVFFLDNDTDKQGHRFCGKPILAPEQFRSADREALILVASSYQEEISEQLKSYGLMEGRDFFCAFDLYQEVTGVSRRRVKQKKQRRSRKTKNDRKILVLGGYGYRNVGDEAQLSANLKELSAVFPDALIKVLSPNPLYTFLEHGRCLVGEAPRTAFYDEGESKLYRLDTIFAKIIFWGRSIWLYLNTMLVRCGLPVLFLPAKRAGMLHELATSDLVFFSGGGYLTGSTLSRLWEALFFIAYADLLRVPVVLSGQTIGVWDSRLTKFLARWAFRKPRIITTRDAEDSLAALSSIGIQHKNIFSTFDDALFCEKAADETVKDALRRSGLTEGRRYVTLNFHFWGMNTPEQKNDIMARIAAMIEYIRGRTEMDICCVPMTPADRQAMLDFMEIRPEPELKLLAHDDDFRIVRGCIAGSEICITMKHHPIIFSLGEGTPVISLAKGEYYRHKNSGALKLFGLEKFNMDIDKDSYIEDFKLLFEKGMGDGDEIKNKINRALPCLKERKKKFVSLIKGISSDG